MEGEDKHFFFAHSLAAAHRPRQMCICIQTHTQAHIHGFQDFVYALLKTDEGLHVVCIKDNCILLLQSRINMHKICIYYQYTKLNKYLLAQYLTFHSLLSDAWVKALIFFFCPSMDRGKKEYRKKICSLLLTYFALQCSFHFRCNCFPSPDHIIPESANFIPCKNVRFKQAIHPQDVVPMWWSFFFNPLRAEPKLWEPSELNYRTNQGST